MPDPSDEEKLAEKFVTRSEYNYDCERTAKRLGRYRMVVCLAAAGIAAHAVSVVLTNWGAWRIAEEAWPWVFIVLAYIIFNWLGPD